MEELVLVSPKGNGFTTSLIVADVFGKRHADVLRDIENMDCSPEFRQRNFALSSYRSSQNKELPMYMMRRDGFSILAMGYTGRDAMTFKEKFIAEFNRMDQLIARQTPAYNLPRTLPQALRALADAEEEKERQALLLEEQQPKVEYYEGVLQSEGLIPITVIAKDLGMSGMALNKLLHNLGVLYKCQDTWVLYAKYQGRGYSKTKTTPYKDRNGITQTSIDMQWTESGREFILSLVKKHQSQTVHD